MSRPRVRGLVWAAQCVIFGVSTLAALLGVHLVEATRSKKLLPPEEFPAAQWLFAHEADAFAIVVVSAVLSLLCAAFLFRSKGLGARAGLIAAVLGQCMLPFVGWGALVAMAGYFTVFLADSTERLESHPRRDDIARGMQGLVRVTPQRLLSVWPELIGVPAVAVTLVVLVEYVALTHPMATPFAGSADLWRFLGLACSAAVFTGARFGFELLLMLLIARALVTRAGPVRVGALALLGFLVTMSTASTWGGLASMVGFVLLVDRLLERATHAATGLLAISLVSGLYMFARTTDVGFDAISGLINAADMAWTVPVLFGAFVLPITLWTHSGFVREVAARPPNRLSDLLRALVAALLSPGGRSSAWVALPYLGLVVWALVFLNYPEFVDYGDVGQRAYTPILFLAVISGAILGYLTIRARPLDSRWGRVGVAIVVALSIVAQVLWSERNVPRMIADRYSVLAHHAVQWIDPLPPRIVDPDPPPVAFLRQERLPAAPPFYKERRPPIIFIMWDAVRADHTSVYGYERPTTPVLKALAAEGVVFERALSSATATTASLRHLFTGEYSSRLAADPNHPPFFMGRLVEKAGYAAIYANATGSDFNGVSPESFSRNHKSPAVAKATIAFPEYHEPPKIRRALELIDQRKSDSFFMFLHLLSPHFSWDHRDEIDDFGEDRVSLYDENIAYCDHWTGVFLDGLRERGLYEDAVIVVTADHGTGLGDHGLWGAFQPYREQIEVPLVIRAPGFAPRRVSDTVSGIDIAPTLVSLFEPGAPNPYDGISLLDAMRGLPISRRYVFSMAAFQDGFVVTDSQESLRLHVYLEKHYLMLFDLKADPNETNNLADEQPERTQALLDVANAWLRLGVGKWDVPWVYEPTAPISLLP